MHFLEPVRLIGIVHSTDGRSATLDEFFMQMSRPVSSLGPPTLATYSTTGSSRASELVQAYGTRLLSQKDVEKLIPGYAGGA